MPRPSQANCYAAAERKPQHYDALAGLEITAALFPTPTRDLNEGTISSTDNLRTIDSWPLEADYFHSPSSIRNIGYPESCSWNRIDFLSVLNRNHYYSRNLPLDTNNSRTFYSPTTFLSITPQITGSLKRCLFCIKWSVATNAKQATL